MHDLLRTLDDEKKSHWPDHLPELTFMYNCTPHASTRFAPYFLFFGHEPRLPIDNMINLNVPEESVNLEEYVTQHCKCMIDVYEQANRNLLQKAKKRKARHDSKVVCDDSVDIGANVLLRKRMTGRNKIQDHWSSVTYVVVDRISPDSNAYKVKAVDGVGETKVVHRVDILPCRTLHEATEETDQSSEDVSDSDSDDSLYVVDNIHEKTGVPDTCIASAVGSGGS